MKKIIVLFLIFLLAVISVFAVQLGFTKIWNLNGVSWGPANLPTKAVQQFAMLSTNFVAGLFAPVVAIVTYRKIPWVVIFAICAFGLTIDLYAALVPLASLPVWFRVAFVISVPIQVYVGTKIGGALVASKQGSAEFS